MARSPDFTSYTSRQCSSAATIYGGPATRTGNARGNIAGVLPEQKNPEKLRLVDERVAALKHEATEISNRR
jgi:hypothetical protein